jgi:hypothetical protein
MAYGSDVDVEPGATTEVRVGAIRGPASGRRSIHDASGGKRLREDCEAGAVVCAGPGTCIVRDEAGKDAGRAEVVAGAVAEVP